MRSAILLVAVAFVARWVGCAQAGEITEAALSQLKAGDSAEQVREKLGFEEPCEVVLGFMIYKDGAKKDARYFVFFMSEPECVWFVAHANSQDEEMDSVAVVWPADLKGRRVEELIREEKERRANKPVETTSGTRTAD